MGAREHMVSDLYKLVMNSDLPCHMSSGSDCFVLYYLL